MSRVDLAVEMIESARNYTVRLLENTKQDDWFRQPQGGVTHIAWQVGHLAVSESRLTLDRIRGARPEDAELVPKSFLRLFARESVPDPDAAKYPSAAEIRAVFDRVHRQALQELSSLAEHDLDSPAGKPHPIATTKYWSLLWCAQHEMLHAGQIGLLRRLLGEKPLW
jgi:uncharacterized damage-inducible protein DinB